MAQIASIPSAAVALVADHASRSDARSPASDPPDGALFAQLLGHGQIVLLTWRQDEGHGLPEALGPQVQLGRKPAPAAA